MLSFKSAIATIVVPGMACFVVPYYILTATHVPFSTPVDILHVMAIFVACLGLSMVVWFSTAFVRRGQGTPIPIAPPTRLVVSRLYCYVRNPMYVGALLIILAEAVYFRSGWLVLYAFAIWAALHIALVIFEEPQLKIRFGADYEQYVKTVPRWIPKMRSR